MAIKPEAERYFQANSEEHELANLLDEGFDVVFRSQFSGFSFWIADPHTPIKERFGLQQEVLVL